MAKKNKIANHSYSSKMNTIVYLNHTHIFYKPKMLFIKNYVTMCLN